MTYTADVPKLWTETIDAHRHTVREAILDATATLVNEHGLLSVTMSKIAERTGIGRATLYKYFPDVEAILHAWHHRQVTTHLQQLTEIHDQPGDARERLGAVLRSYAKICQDRFSHDHPGSQLAAVLHQGIHLSDAHDHVHDLIRDLLCEAAATGDLRDDVPPDELATYCMHALNAAGSLPSSDAVQRLVTVTIDSLQPRTA